MNESDLNNIHYVLSLHPNDISSWVLSMSDENEIMYALSIIECAHWYLLDESVQELQDCKMANKVLGEIFYAH
jgi:hypothetical protein